MVKVSHREGGWLVGDLTAEQRRPSEAISLQEGSPHLHRSTSCCYPLPHPRARRTPNWCKAFHSSWGFPASSIGELGWGWRAWGGNNHRVWRSHCFVKEKRKTSQGWSWRKKGWRIWETEEYSSLGCGKRSSVLAVFILTHRQPLLNGCLPYWPVSFFLFHFYINIYWKPTFVDGFLGIGWYRSEWDEHNTCFIKSPPNWLYK